ncbi:hypothetical protein E3T33_06520 [Cryobacterium sp. TMT1-2-1]|nr:hypothetical protein E3T33_06520 [Cryobacterium sp. TMT1-2-1]TFD85717.1 hypothetical protein E3T56_07675 [Cryobacterium psychrotolerans]
MTEPENAEAEPPDGSTDISEAQKRRTDALGTGASADGEGDGEQDTASGGAPDESDTTEPDGTPVENPSG